MGLQMNSTTVRARLVIALLMIAGSFSVALVAESATAAPAFRVNLTVSDTRPDVGEAVQLSGKVTPAAPGKRVLVQGKAAGTGWVTIAAWMLSTSSTYTGLRAGSPAPAGVALRIVKAASRTSRPRRQPGPRPPGRGDPELPRDHHHDAARRCGRCGVLRDDRDGTTRVPDTSRSRPATCPRVSPCDEQIGEITGTPTTQGTSNFTVLFTDPDGLADFQALSIVGRPRPPSPR